MTADIAERKYVTKPHKNLSGTLETWHSTLSQLFSRSGILEKIEEFRAFFESERPNPFGSRMVTYVSFVMDFVLQPDAFLAGSRLSKPIRSCSHVCDPEVMPILDRVPVAPSGARQELHKEFPNGFQTGLPPGEEARDVCGDRSVLVTRCTGLPREMTPLIPEHLTSMIPTETKRGASKRTKAQRGVQNIIPTS